MRKLMYASGLIGIVFALLSATAAYLLDRSGIDLRGDPLRLLGFAEATLMNGCWPRDVPIACRVDGRAWRTQNVGAPWSVKSLGAADAILRFELRHDERWKHDIATHHIAERNEISDLRRQSYRENTWLSFKLIVQPGSPSSSDWLDFAQLHATPDTNEIAERELPPVWSYGLGRNDVFQIVASSKASSLAGTASSHLLFEDHSFQRGVPYAFVYHFLLNTDGRGILQVWRNDTLIVDYKGPLGYQQRQGPYLKFGLYRSRPCDGETVAIELHDIKISHSGAPTEM